MTLNLDSQPLENGETMKTQIGFQLLPVPTAPRRREIQASRGHTGPANSGHPTPPSHPSPSAFSALEPEGTLPPLRIIASPPSWLSSKYPLSTPKSSPLQPTFILTLHLLSPTEPTSLPRPPRPMQPGWDPAWDPPHCTVFSAVCLLGGLLEDRDPAFIYL